ncbi:unnamed protein product [Leptidea sinapis]|uniref:Uncharacterized protein n=1 Tax=Leptidea sinapis TaxID=189913 RepID=A0A5E4QXN6_9NEOP|nr:unnamed protein product [Leptidea sinapis]
MKEMKELFLDTQKNNNEQIKSILTALKDIQQVNEGIQKSITFLSDQNSDFQKKIASLEIQVKKDMEYITLLENKLEESQRTERKNNIEIKNVPLKGAENKQHLIKMIYSILSLFVCANTCQQCKYALSGGTHIAFSHYCNFAMEFMAGSKMNIIFLYTCTFACNP